MPTYRWAGPPSHRNRAGRSIRLGTERVV